MQQYFLKEKQKIKKKIEHLYAIKNTQNILKGFTMNRLITLFLPILLATTHVTGMESGNEASSSVLVNIPVEIPEKDILYYGALGNTAMVNELLNKGTNPNICDDKNMTLLHYAAWYGYIDIVDRLLAHPDFNKNDITDKLGSVFYSNYHSQSVQITKKSPFTLAVEHKQIDVIERILKIHPINCDELLCSAAHGGSLNLVRTLLACKVNANALDEKEFSPLYRAASAGHANIIELLIDYKANLDYQPKGETGYTALHRTCHDGHTYAAQVLIDYSNGDQINAKSGNDDYTPLHMAVLFEHIDVVRALLMHPKIKVNALANDFTPLDLIIYYGKSDDIKQLLIKHGGRENFEKSCSIQ